MHMYMYVQCMCVYSCTCSEVDSNRIFRLIDHIINPQKECKHITSCSLQDASSHQSDSEELLSESHDPRPHPPAGPLSSSSSRRSSITDLVTTATHGELEGVGRERAGVVEWHPKTCEDRDAEVTAHLPHIG